MEIPFYQKIRPDKLEDMVGQKHILSEGMIIEKLYRQKKITNMIMYGPPGTERLRSQTSLWIIQGSRAIN